MTNLSTQTIHEVLNFIGGIYPIENFCGDSVGGGFGAGRYCSAGFGDGTGHGISMAVVNGHGQGTGEYGNVYGGGYGHSEVD